MARTLIIIAAASLVVDGAAPQRKGFDECDGCFVVFESLAQVLRTEHEDRRVPSRFRLDTQDSFGDEAAPRHANAVGRREVSYAAADPDRASFLLGKVCGVASTFYATKKSGHWIQNETRAADLAAYDAGDRDDPPAAATDDAGARLAAYCAESVAEERAALLDAMAADTIVDVSSSDASAVGRMGVCKNVLRSCETDKELDKAQRRWDASEWYAADKRAKAAQAAKGKKAADKLDYLGRPKKARARKYKAGRFEPGGF